MDDVIQVNNLGFRYGDEPILSGVTFKVAPGDFVALIGANGAGKSTLMRLILGELTPREGSVSLFGEDVRRFKHWPKVGYLPQNAMRMGDGFPASVREIVEASLYAKAGLFRLPSRENKARAAAALNEVGMGEFTDRLIGKLSGGQQQRVMMARVLAGDPEVMILDEPTSGVDAGAVDSLYSILGRLNREKGLSILLVTHDVMRASKLAGRVLCLEEGSLVELKRQQVAEELEHKHKHPAPDDSADDVAHGESCRLRVAGDDRHSHKTHGGKGSDDGHPSV